MIDFSVDPAFRNTVQKAAVEKTRLGIPILFGYDVIHGFRTVYPISLAQGCSFNTALVRAMCSLSAQETKLSGVDWTFSPMIDVGRDPRWGRVSEGYGEDPYTNAMFGVEPFLIFGVVIGMRTTIPKPFNSKTGQLVFVGATAGGVNPLIA